MLIHRANILKSTERIVAREDWNFCRPIKISFSGEDGDDLGGPGREFLRLLMKEMDNEILQGSTDGHFFSHDLGKLSNKTYEMAGRLTSFSILHGGQGFPVFNMALYHFITNREPHTSILPDILCCVMDLDVRERLLKIQQSVTQEEYEKILEDSSDWCADQGLGTIAYKSIKKKSDLFQVLVKNEIFYRVHSEIVQFQEGLNKVGCFFNTILLAPDEFKDLFTYQHRKLTFPALRSLYKIDFSPEGSNYRAMENDAIYCLEAFSADSEGGATGITLEEVLKFWTGADAVPPMGFPNRLEVTFCSVKQLPTAHTCGLILCVCRGYSDPDLFSEDMVKAIRWGGGFHLV